LQNVELSHVLRVFFFHAVKMFQDHHLTSRISGCAIAGKHHIPLS
jgi:hypothetical protein